MSNAIDQSKIKTRKGKYVFGCLCLGIYIGSPMIMFLIVRPQGGDLIGRVQVMVSGIVGMLLILGSIILLVKTRRVSYGLWCNNCNKFVNKKWNRCSICRTKNVSWKRLPR